MHEVLLNRLGGLSLPEKSVVRITDRPDTTFDVYHGRKTIQQYNISRLSFFIFIFLLSGKLSDIDRNLVLKGR